MCDASKYGQGEYTFLGNNTDDNSAVYIEADYDAVRPRSVILLDWQGKNNWIGTVILILFHSVAVVKHFNYIKDYINSNQISLRNSAI